MCIRDSLYAAITSGDFPQWDLGVQVFDDAFADAFDFDVLDPTKLIPEEILPVRVIARPVSYTHLDVYKRQAYTLWAALPGTASMMGVAWAPDGRHLAAVGQAAQLRVWAVEPRVAVGDICAAVGDPIGVSRWSALLTDQTYQQPCP